MILRLKNSGISRKMQMCKLSKLYISEGSFLSLPTERGGESGSDHSDVSPCLFCYSFMNSADSLCAKLICQV